MALTPLLASAACGIFDFRNAEEPVRRSNRTVTKYQAVVDSVDLENKTATCTSKVKRCDDVVFKVKYDRLILCPGCSNNTFGTPGVEEHAYFMKTVRDAMRLRARILDIFEFASLPTLSDEERRYLLHVAIVGGGPTGVAIAAEVDDLVSDHLVNIYPHLKGFFSLSIYDVAKKILTPFDEKLGEHAMESFNRRHVAIRTGKHIESVEKDFMQIKEDGKVGFGILVWATGNKQVPLVDQLDVKKSERLPRILTDSRLRVKRKDGTVMDGVYALGDAADIEKEELPTTAEVAVQKAKYLARSLNIDSSNAFKYKTKPLVAYVGGGDGVVEGKTDWTGHSAFLAWRSGSLEWSRSWRRRAMIMINWFMNWWDGREIARKN